MFNNSFSGPVRLIGTIIAGLGLLATLVIWGAGSASAAVITGPAVRMLPAHLPAGPGQLILTASDTTIGSRVRLQPDLGLRSQKWHLRSNGTSVVQIVNDQSGLCLRGNNDLGFTIRLVGCADFNDINPTPDELRQFWLDRDFQVGGQTVHQFEQTTDLPVVRPMGIRGAGTTAGTLLERQALGSSLSPNQLFRFL